MQLFLGIDGGGTGCRAAMADAAGHILGRGAAGPANITSDPDGAQANIMAAAQQAAKGADLSQIHAGLGLAGAGAPDAKRQLVSALPFGRCRIETDAVSAVKGALAGADGVVAAIGTGSVFAAQQAGRVRVIGGKGLILGDEGSGAWLGRALLARALRAADGFVVQTPLLAQMVQRFDGEAGIIAFAARATPADFAALAKPLTQSDDPAARFILKQGADEVDRALALLSGDASRQVVFLGGLGAAYAALLTDRWHAAAPRGTALDGALILAREA